MAFMAQPQSNTAKVYSFEEFKARKKGPSEEMKQEETKDDNSNQFKENEEANKKRKVREAMERSLANRRIIDQLAANGKSGPNQ